MTVSDHIDVILEGLSEDYNVFIVSVTSKTDPYTVNEIESLLVTQEERIEKYKKEASPSLSANVAQVTPSPKQNKPPPIANSGQSRFLSNTSSSSCGSNESVFSNHFHLQSSYAALSHSLSFHTSSFTC